MLVYPTLNLFLYDLRAGLGQNETDIQENRAHFKKKLPAHFDHALFDQLDNGIFETEYLELLGQNRVISLSPHPNFPAHDGYYYPVRLNDSYGLLLNCSLKDNQKITDLTWLKSLQKWVAESVANQKGMLGETWFFSAQLDDLEQSTQLAANIYQTLMPNANTIENHGQSDFLGGVLFEFWGYDSSKPVDEKHHLIIIFYANNTTLLQETEFYSDWMRLWFYRHKITWAYRQSRQLAKHLKTGAIKIQACEQQLRESTNAKKLGSQQLQATLNEAWHILSDYATHLEELNNQAHTIEINISNYHKRLTLLAEKSASSLALPTFYELAKEKYWLQVQKDYESFSPKLRHLENLIGYIRASVAIREETRDRDLMNTAAIWGSGLATGAIVASVAGQLPLLTETGSWWNFGISLGFSIGAAILAGLLIKLIIWWRQKKN